MAYGCYNSVQLCAVRASIIDTDGSPIFSNTDGSAYDLRPVSLQISPTVSAGDTVEQKDGCGNTCYSATNPDTNTGADLVLTICTFDVEFIALLTGASIVIDGSAENIGFAIGTDTASPTEFHAWTKAYDGSSAVASPRTYWHHVFPNVTWTLGNNTLDVNPMTVVLNGTAQNNSNLGDGGFSDVLETIQPGIGYWYLPFLADDIPVSSESPYNANGIACGYVDTPADDS